MLRNAFATRLRALAQLIDGREMVDLRWHRASIQTMNTYVVRTEIELKRLREKCGEPHPIVPWQTDKHDSA
jgi:hypothetical protein